MITYLVLYLTLRLQCQCLEESDFHWFSLRQEGETAGYKSSLTKFCILELHKISLTLFLLVVLKTSVDSHVICLKLFFLQLKLTCILKQLSVC